MPTPVHCDICGKFLPNGGLKVHKDRIHFSSTKYSSGRNNSYNLAEYKEKIKEGQDKRWGKKQSIEKQCIICGTSYTIVTRPNSKEFQRSRFCSYSCSHVRTPSKKRKIKIGTLVEKPCDECGELFSYIKYSNAKKERKCCSKSCATRYGRKDRDNVTRQNRPELTNYRSDCQFRFNLNDYPDEFDFSLIEKYGWYKAKNKGDNMNGISRDHMVSIKYGFENNIPAEHIRHPANCQLLRHSNNVSKYSKNSITYEELLSRIKIWEYRYKS